MKRGEGWKLEKLGDICDNLDSQRIPVTQRDRRPGEYPYYGASGVVDYVDKYIFDEDLLLVSEDGANLLARTYPIAFSITGKTWVNNHAHVLRFKNMVTQRFVEYYLNSIPLDKYVNGMAQPKLNQAMLNSIPVPVPPIQEQHRIVTLLDKTFTALNTVHANAERNLINAKELFESALDETFRELDKTFLEIQLTDLCEDFRLITYGVVKLGDHIQDGVPCLRTSNVRWLRIDTNDMKRIAPSLSRQYSRTILKGGEVLVNVRGTLGGVAVVSQAMAGWNMSREVAIVPIDKNKIDPYFISYFIASGISQKWFGGVTKGAAYVGINIEDLRLLPVPVPPLVEQCAIVSHLDSLLAETKKLEGVYQTKIDAVEELRKSILQRAFEGRL